MNYYKLILDNKIVGLANSNSFIRFSPVTQSFLRANEVTGEYITWRGLFYRDTWMAPIKSQLEYISIQTIQITEQEYNILLGTFETEETIDYEHEEVEPSEEEQEPVDPIEMETLNYVRSSKIKEMSYQCNKTIENGFDIEMEDGTYHYSYALEDQLNLMNLSAAIARGEEQLSYHADGELCRFYTAAEINEIISVGNTWKTYHTTYFNALKAYINSLETIEEISAITYGIELPEEFKTDVLRVIE